RRDARRQAEHVAGVVEERGRQVREQIEAGRRRLGLDSGGKLAEEQGSFPVDATVVELLVLEVRLDGAAGLVAALGDACDVALAKLDAILRRERAEQRFRRRRGLTDARGPLVDRGAGLRSEERRVGKEGQGSESR